MFKIKILSVGKTKECWLDQALNEYLKRLSSIATIEFAWAKNDIQLLQLVKKETRVICLDPQGKLMTSEQFSSFVYEKLVSGGTYLTFVIGGPEGLPLEIKQNSILISFSPLTFTHQIIRLLLLEQLYRAFEISKGSQYHK